jgi:hypothetical protein
MCTRPPSISVIVNPRPRMGHVAGNVWLNLKRGTQTDVSLSLVQDKIAAIGGQDLQRAYPGNAVAFMEVRPMSGPRFFNHYFWGDR